MGLKLYDPKSVIVTFGPTIISGFSDGTMVRVERDEDTFSKRVGVDGEATRVRNMNRGGSITVVLDQASASNLALSTLATADEEAPNGVSILPMLVKDNAGNSLHFAEKAWIKKPPVSEYGKESGDREWVFDTGSLVDKPGGN